MEKFNLINLQKRGSISMNSTTTKVIGVVLVLTLLSALAPSMFASNWSDISGAPVWLGTIMPLLIAIGLVLLVWKAVK